MPRPAPSGPAGLVFGTMPTCVFLNGKFFGGEPSLSSGGAAPLADARLSAFDAGFQHAVGLFETMTGGVVRRGVEGPTSHGEEIETWVLHLDEHMERLAASARTLGLSQDLRTSALEEAVLETVRRSGLSAARVRLTVTGGDLSLLSVAQSAAQGQSAPRAPDPTVLIVAQPATPYPRQMFEHGVAITLAEARVNPLNPAEGHKTLNYWWRLRELQRAGTKGAAEALVLSITNHLAGGCVSNLLLVQGENLLTPIAKGEEPEIRGSEQALHSPVLPGVTRNWAIGRAERMGLEIHKRMLSVQDVLDADEVMLTNSSWGVLPIVKLEGSALGGGKPGRVTLDLIDQWRDLRPMPGTEL